jgi:hypothetical protein
LPKLRDGMQSPSLKAGFRREGFVAGTTKLEKGSKRNIRQLRWTLSKKLSAVLLLLVVLIETIWIAWWLTGHSFD